MGGQKKSGTEPDTFLLHTFRQIGTSRQEKEKEQGKTQNGISTPHRQEGRAKKRRNCRPEAVSEGHLRAERETSLGSTSQVTILPTLGIGSDLPTAFHDDVLPCPEKKDGADTATCGHPYRRFCQTGPCRPRHSIKNQRPALASSTFSRSAAPSLMRFSLSRYAVLLTRG